MRVKVIIFLGWVSLYLLVSMTLCTPPTGRNINSAYPELYIYQVGNDFCVIDFMEINNFVKARGGLPLTPNDLKIIERSMWTDALNLTGVSTGRCGITVAASYPNGRDLNLILYHEVMHWVKSTRPKIEVVLSLFWNRAVSMVFLPVIFLFVVWPIFLKKTQQNFPKWLIVLETVVLFLLLTHAAFRYADPEEISIYCKSRELWSKNAPRIAVIYNCYPNINNLSRDATGRIYMEEKWSSTESELADAWQFRHGVLTHTMLIINSLLYVFLTWLIFKSIIYLCRKDWRAKIWDNFAWAFIIVVLIFVRQNGYGLFLQEVSVNEDLPLRPKQIVFSPTPTPTPTFSPTPTISPLPAQEPKIIFDQGFNKWYTADGRGIMETMVYVAYTGENPVPATIIIKPINQKQIQVLPILFGQEAILMEEKSKGVFVSRCNLKFCKIFFYSQVTTGDPVTMVKVFAGGQEKTLKIDYQKK